VDATEVVKKVVMVVKALAPEKIRHDLLGKVFHELIPFEIRKAVAAFYTNNEAAEILAQLAIDKPDAKVMDLAVGSGTLLVAAYRRKRELLQKFKGTIELEDHKRFLEQDLTGIDIMPFAAHLAVVHLSLQALLYETEKVRVAVWDSTELKPGQTIPAIWSELKAAYRRPTLDMFAKGGLPEEAYVTKGTVTLEGVGGERIPLERADLVIMNPPFTRQERLPTEYKAALLKRFQEYEDFTHGQLGLYGYFMLLADRFLKNDGRIALVLPATVLRLNSTLGIRKMLLKNYHIENIITTLQRAAFSEGAQFREILFIGKKLDTRKNRITPNNLKCTITTLKKIPSNLEEARKFAESIKAFSSRANPGDAYESDEMSTMVTTQAEMNKKVGNLYTFVAAQDLRIINLWNRITSIGKDKLTRLWIYIKNAKGEVIRGIEMEMKLPLSAYSTFVLYDESRAIKSKDAWVVKNIRKESISAENRFTHTAVTIPTQATLFGLRRLSGVDTIDVTTKLDYIVVDKFNDAPFFFMDVEKALRTLPTWKNYIEGRSANLVFCRRFDLSAPGTRLLGYFSFKPLTPTKLFWCIKGISELDGKILALWFNSTINLLQVFLERMETRGAFMNFDKYALQGCLILNSQVMLDADKKMLSEIFEEVKHEAFPSLLNQLTNKFPARVKIDKAFLKVLGFGDDETNRILDYLYPALANEIQQLKTLMQG